MNENDFSAFLANDPSDNSNLALHALWHDGKGDWEKAHELAQQANSKEGDWVHAYLHRKEGDEGNASYWYSRAGKVKPKCSLVQEWEALVRELYKPPGS